MVSFWCVQSCLSPQCSFRYEVWVGINHPRWRVWLCSQRFSLQILTLEPSHAHHEQWQGNEMSSPSALSSSSPEFIHRKLPNRIKTVSAGSHLECSIFCSEKNEHCLNVWFSTWRKLFRPWVLLMPETDGKWGDRASKRSTLVPTVMKP